MTTEEKRQYQIYRLLHTLEPNELAFKPIHKLSRRAGAGRFSPVGGTEQIRIGKELADRIRTRAHETGRTIAQVVESKDF